MTHRRRLPPLSGLLISAKKKFGQYQCSLVRKVQGFDKVWAGARELLQKVG